MTITCSCTFCSSFFDLATDVFLAVEYLLNGKVVEGVVTICLFAVALILQACFSYITGRTCCEVLAALCGLSSLLAILRLMKNDEHTGATESPMSALCMVVSIETCFEAIPQMIAQIVMMFTRSTRWSLLQLAAVATSTLSVAFGISMVDRAFDDLFRVQNTEPLVYGWYPTNFKDRSVVFLVSMLRFWSYSIARLLMLGVIVDLVGVQMAMAVFTGELLLFILVRTFVGNAVWCLRNRANFLTPVVFLQEYIAFEFVPLIVVHNPYFVGGLTSTLCEAYVLISNFAFSAVAYSIRGDGVQPKLDEAWTFGVLASATLIFSMCSAILAKYMEPHFRRRTWLEHHTTTSHIRDHLWNSIVYEDFGPLLNDHRACLLTTFPTYYWPKDVVHEWLEESWSTWYESPPTWFTEEWQHSIPLDVLPARARKPPEAREEPSEAREVQTNTIVIGARAAWIE